MVFHYTAEPSKSESSSRFSMNYELFRAAMKLGYPVSGATPLSEPLEFASKLSEIDIKRLEREIKLPVKITYVP
jgi:hypothetical protein